MRDKQLRIATHDEHASTNARVIKVVEEVLNASGKIISKIVGLGGHLMLITALRDLSLSRKFESSVPLRVFACDSLYISTDGANVDRFLINPVMFN